MISWGGMEDIGSDLGKMSMDDQEEQDRINVAMCQALTLDAYRNSLPWSSYSTGHIISCANRTVQEMQVGRGKSLATDMEDRHTIPLYRSANRRGRQR